MASKYVPGCCSGWGHGGKGCAPRKWGNWNVFGGLNPPCTGCNTEYSDREIKVSYILSSDVVNLQEAYSSWTHAGVL